MESEEQTVEEMRAKVVLGSMLIEMLVQEDDPRAPVAIEVLQDQQRKLNEILVSKIAEERTGPPPSPVVVGLSSIELGAKALR